MPPIKPPEAPKPARKVPRKARWVAPPESLGVGEPAITPDTPPEVVREIFARRLWSLLVKKGWSQSEFSRAAGIARDSVSTYIRRVSMPDPVNAQKMADALGISVEELIPSSRQISTAESVPAVELKQSVGGASGRVWLRVNKEMPFDIAVKILALLENLDD